MSLSFCQGGGDAAKRAAGQGLAQNLTSPASACLHLFPGDFGDICRASDHGAAAFGAFG